MSTLFDNKKNTILLFLFSAVLGVLFDYLFYEHGLGINYFIYIGAILAATYWALSFKKEFNATIYLIMSTGILLLSANYFVSTNEFFLIMNFLLIPALYYLTILLSLGVNKKIYSDLFVYIFVPISHLNKFFKTGIGFVNSRSTERSRSTGKILLGILLSAFALIIIIPLMLKADSAFHLLLLRLFNFKISSDIIVQSILFFLVSSYGFALIYFIFHGIRQHDSASQWSNNTTQTQHPELDNKSDLNTYAYTILTFLIVIGFVFLCFSIIQISYLFLRVNSGLPLDFSYADYAREGVFQLWALTAMNVLIVLICEFLSRKITAIAPKIFNIIFSIYVIINFGMTASAFYKMMLYDSAYGLTRLRMLVFLHLILQTALLILLLYKIWVKKFPFIKAAFILTFAFYIGINYINIDKIITQRNITRYELTGNIDMHYLLYNLSYDSFETIYRYSIDKLGYQSNTEYSLPEKADFNTNDEYDKALMYYELSDEYTQLKNRYKSVDWREFNLTVNRLLDLK